MESEKLPEMEITCNSCKSFLWTHKVLARQGNRVISSEWKSYHPERYKGAPKSWDCPLCGKEFAQKQKDGQYRMRVIIGTKVQYY